MKKVQFEFTDETYAAINNLAKITDARTMAGVIRDALKTYAWLIDEQRAGNKILSRNPKSGETKELVGLAKVEELVNALSG